MTVGVSPALAARYRQASGAPSSNEEADVIASYRLGVNSYIVQPVDSAQFAESVRLLGLHWLLLTQPPRPAVGTDAGR